MSSTPSPTPSSIVSPTYTGFSKDELAAFGDDYNDIDMFNLVGHGICMGNGVEEVKKKASWVTTPIEQDGIKNGLIHLGVIEK